MIDERVRRFRGARRQGRCPIEQRKLAIEYARERAAEGTAIGGVARELGTTPATLRNWMKQAESEFRPVEVVGPVPPWVAERTWPVLTLVTTAGFRLEGLNVVAAARLLQLLG